MQTLTSFMLAFALLLAAPVAARAQSEPMPEIKVIAKGNFKGANGNEASGTISILDHYDYEGRRVFTTILFHDNFRFNGAPQVRIGLGHSSGDRPYFLRHTLQKKSGMQAYPAIDFDDIKTDTVYLWSPRSDKLLGSAEFKTLGD